MKRGEWRGQWAKQLVSCLTIDYALAIDCFAITWRAR
jgi:hypothetical protein